MFMKQIFWDELLRAATTIMINKKSSFDIFFTVIKMFMRLVI